MKIVLVLIVFLTGCVGLPKTTDFSVKNGFEYTPRAVSLVFDKSQKPEKITHEVIARFEDLFKKELANNDILLQAKSDVSIGINFSRYEDGDVVARGVTGAILGVAVGELAKIEAEITIFSKEKVIRRANILVTSSRFGWNFIYGYGGANMIKKPFVKEAVKVLLYDE